MGVRIRPRHRGYRSCYVHVQNYEDLEALIDVECELSNSGIDNGMTFFGSDRAVSIRAAARTGALRTTPL